MTRTYTTFNGTKTYFSFNGKERKDKTVNFKKVQLVEALEAATVPGILD